MMGEKIFLWIILIWNIAMMIVAIGPMWFRRQFLLRFFPIRVAFELYGITMFIGFAAIASTTQGWAHPIIGNYFSLSFFAVFTGIALHIALNLKKYLPKPKRLIPKPKLEMAFSGQREYVYLARRKDGIYKVGMSTDPGYRMQKLAEDYDADFAPIAIWQVQNMRQCERDALDLTRAYHHIEGRRRELRLMSARQAYGFISEFTKHLEQQYGTA